MNRPYFQSEGIKIQTAGDLLTASVMGWRSFSTSTLDFARSPNCQKKKKKNVYSRGYHGKVNKQH